VGYTILKWAHAARPEVLTELFNMCLDTGTHPWKHATIVILNKLNKPDYSIPKAYHPIALMECMGKVLERIIAKKVNNDIEAHDLLSMSQSGSRPAHCAVDAVVTLVHRI
jgi:hypothetical protein